MHIIFYLPFLPPSRTDDHPLKRPVDIRRLLCTHLKEQQPILIRKCLTFLGRDRPPLNEIALVAEKAQDDARVGVRLELGEPLAGVLERGAVRHVIHYKG